MKHDHDEEEGEGGHESRGHWGMKKPMRKEFKLAMLEKKEKILKAELEFIGKMKELIQKLPEGEK